MTVHLDNRTRAVPVGGAWRLEQHDGQWCRRSVATYPTTAETLRALATDSAQWGAWEREARRTA